MKSLVTHASTISKSTRTMPSILVLRFNSGQRFNPNWKEKAYRASSTFNSTFSPLTPRRPFVVSKTRLEQYETDYDAYILGTGTAPSLDLLRLAPDTERAATEKDRKEVRFVKELMEKHATAAKTALGVFNMLTTKSVQTDLSHILDDSLIHPRNKVFQLEQFFRQLPRQM